MSRTTPSFEPLETRRHLAVDLQFTQGPITDSIVVGASRPIAGNAILFNAGDTATSGPVTYQVILASDFALTQDVTVLGTGTTSAAIAPNAEPEVTFSFATPASLLGTTRYIGIVIDPANAVAESDEADNRQANASPLRIASTLATDTIAGTDGDDRIRVARDGDLLVVTTTDVNGNALSTRAGPLANFARLTVDLKGGNDVFNGNPGGGPSSLTIPLVVDGGAGADSILGSEGDDTLAGGDGSDTIGGGGGADSILGGAGDDAINGNDGDDYISADAGNDSANGDAGSDFVGGGAGNDNLAGGDGDDQVAGDTGNDSVRGDAGDDRVAGNAGSDRVRGNAGNDTLLGQNGRDYLQGGTGADLLIGGGGNDVLSVEAGSDGVDTLSGNGGRDEGYYNAGAILASIELKRPL